MAEELNALQGLLGLPDLAHAAIAGFCGQREHLLLMSTSSAVMGTFVVHMRDLCTPRHRRDEEPVSEVALVGLLRRLPNLRSLKWYSPAVGAFFHSVMTEGCCTGLKELELYDDRAGGLLGTAIGTGSLPSLEKFRCWSDMGEALAGISEGLNGGASPRLTEVTGTCDHEGLVALAEALEARMALRCCHVTILYLSQLSNHSFGDLATPDALRRLYTSPALAKLKDLHFDSFENGDEVAAMADALGQLKPQELTDVSLAGHRFHMIPLAPIFACLTPAVMPSLHTVRLSLFNVGSAACTEQITAALREGALIYIKRLEVEIGGWDEDDDDDLRDEISLECLLSALARSHGCPNLHTLRFNECGPLRSLGGALAEGAFPNLQELLISRWIMDGDVYLQELAASIEHCAPCCATLRRVEVFVDQEDLVNLPRLAKALLASLPGLELVRLSGNLPHLEDKVEWKVEGGREALLGLNRAIEALGGSNDEELQGGIKGMLQDLYRARR